VLENGLEGMQQPEVRVFLYSAGSSSRAQGHESLLSSYDNVGVASDNPTLWTGIICFPGNGQSSMPMQSTGEYCSGRRHFVVADQPVVVFNSSATLTSPCTRASSSTPIPKAHRPQACTYRHPPTYLPGMRTYAHTH